MKKAFGLLGPQVCFAAPDDGGGAALEDNEKDPKDAELAAAKLELAEEKKKREEAEHKLSEAEKAKLTEDERKAVEQKEFHEATTRKFKTLQAKALGIDEKYIDIIKGDTPDEIEANANLLAEMLKKNSEDVEAKVKQGLAKTGAPGASANMDEAVDSVDFYRNIMKGQGK